MEYYYIYDEKKRFTHERSLEKKTKSTEIKPPNIGSDEVAIFDEIKESWSLQKDLQKTKTLKLFSLVKDFNKSKTITIINGNSLIIKHDCPKREYFLKILEEVKRLDDNMEISHIFTQKSSGLGFKVSPFIANYILLKDFTENINGRIIKVREYNKAIVYDNAESKIEQATSIEELEAINWNFLKPNGIEININERVVDIMNGYDENLKSAVERVTDENGQLHFIKTLDELAK